MIFRIKKIAGRLDENSCRPNFSQKSKLKSSRSNFDYIHLKFIIDWSLKIQIYKFKQPYPSKLFFLDEIIFSIANIKT